MASLFHRFYVCFTFLFGILLSVYLCSARYCAYELGRKFPNTNGCTTLEHCIGNYNHRTGVCSNSQQCEPGWMGPSCQYVNLALNPLNSDSVFDGNMSTHRRIPDATVNLNGTFVVSALNIILFYQQYTSITIRDKSNSICFQGRIPQATSTIYFSRPHMTDKLKIHFGIWVAIKEIEVFGGRNIALWKKTNQSTVYYEGNVRFTSDKAVDGNGAGEFNLNKTCTHTSLNVGNAFWDLQLDKVYSLIAVKIKNRIDSHQHRIDGFKLFATTSQGRKILLYNDSNPPAFGRDSILIDSSHIPNIPVTGITIEGSNSGDKILTLCEVYVYACIPVNDGGENCVSSCPEHCLTGYVCSPHDLTCPVCKEGWQGPDCNQSIQCQRPTNLPLHLQILSDKHTYQYKERIQFKCAEGFNLHGNSSKQCTQSAEFKHDLPTCSAIQCQRPTNLPLHVQILSEKHTYQYKERIQFTCAEGFNLHGNSSKQCTQSADFKHSLPTCSAIQCQRPARLSRNIHILPKRATYHYMEMINFTCAIGYILRGNSFKQCIQSTDFQHDLPSCLAVQCNRSSLDSDHLSIDPSNDYYPYNTTLSFCCNEGYNLVGPSTAFCGNNNTFMFNAVGVPKCKAVKCSLPSFRQREIKILKDKDITSFGYNSTVMFHCEKGFNLKGSHLGICGQNNSFQLTGGRPFCEAVQCKLPDFRNFINDVNNRPSYKYKESVTLRCKNGYQTTENLTGICDDGNNFTLAFPDEPFTCQDVAEEEKSLTAPIAGGTAGGLFAAIVLTVLVVVIFHRKRRAKYADSRQYEDFTLDDIEHQYAEINIERKNREQNDKQDHPCEQVSTYYNLNSEDAGTAKLWRDEEYFEFSSISPRSATAVSVMEFKNYVTRKKKDEEGLFAAEFKRFYTGLQFPATAAVAPGNRSKNKYRNIYPYDETRVSLKTGNGTSDFINASFIQGYGNIKSYIATQGPLKNTIDDFWWMVWNEECEKIVMLTNLIDDKVECIQYWPEEDKMNIGNLTLEMVDTESLEDFKIRTFCLKNQNNEGRIIRQFHFTAWPDKEGPHFASSLVRFHSKVIHAADQGKGPLVVHCSAGIGRTGTFIALDILTQQAKESGFVDVFGSVETLRRQRVNMVQTLEQYILVHDALLEALAYTSLDPSRSEFPQIYQDLLTVDPESSKRNVDIYFENIASALSLPPESAYSLAKDPANKKKNRYNNILPIDNEMPRVRDENNRLIYINAVFLPAYKTKRSFIVTQMPLKQTVEDFWRLLFDQKVSTIVMLNEKETDKTSGKENKGRYWPEHLKTGISGIFHVTAQKVENEETGYTVMDLLCSVQGEKEKRSIRIFICTCWPDSTAIPDSVSKFLKLINDVELHNNRNKTGPIVVHCMNGAGKCGLFCVLHVVLERMKLEQDVAIHQVIQQMRNVRPSIIPNVEQLKFCYDAVMEFLNQFDAYSNFQ